MNGCPMTAVWQDAIDVYDMAVSAIRNQEPVTNRHELTNADRIRSMSDGELAVFMSEFKECGGGCLVGKGVKDCSGICATADTLRIWLQQPAERRKHENHT